MAALFIAGAVVALASLFFGVAAVIAAVGKGRS